MKKPVNEKKPEHPTVKSAPNTRDQELIEAAERVYRKYGSDLPAFYRDAQRERLVKRG